jgi:hypothetical protein
MIFVDDDDRREYLTCLGIVVQEREWDCVA